MSRLCSAVQRSATGSPPDEDGGDGDDRPPPADRVRRTTVWPAPARNGTRWDPTSPEAPATATRMEAAAGALSGGCAGRSVWVGVTAVRARVGGRGIDGTTRAVRRACPPRALRPEQRTAERLEAH